MSFCTVSFRCLFCGAAPAPFYYATAHKSYHIIALFHIIQARVHAHNRALRPFLADGRKPRLCPEKKHPRKPFLPYGAATPKVCTTILPRLYQYFRIMLHFAAYSVHPLLLLEYRTVERAVLMRHNRRANRIACDVDRRARHIEDAVDTHNQADTGHRQADRVEHHRQRN